MNYINEFNPVTVWFRLNHESNEFEHNHIEDGHVFAKEPVPISGEQKKAWKNALWQYDHRYITDDYILVF